MHFIQISTGTFSLRTAMVLKITAWLLIFVRIILSNHVSLLFLCPSLIISVFEKHLNNICFDYNFPRENA